MPPAPSQSQKQHTTNPDRGHVKECSCTGPAGHLNHIESLEKPRGGTEKSEIQPYFSTPKFPNFLHTKTPLMQTSKTRNSKLETRNSKKLNNTNLKQLGGNSKRTQFPRLGTTILQPSRAAQPSLQRPKALDGKTRIHSTLCFLRCNPRTKNHFTH